MTRPGPCLCSHCKRNGEPCESRRARGYTVCYECATFCGNAMTVRGIETSNRETDKAGSWKQWQ